MSIHWYPGHMAKARRQLLESLKLIDILVELADARTPYSSRTQAVSLQKPRVLFLTKSDLADAAATDAWMDYFGREGHPVHALNVLNPRSRKVALGGIQQAAATLNLRRAPRLLIIGIPNVGKSSLINQLTNRGAAKVGAKPGVTRGKQWIKTNDFQLLDTPGIMLPRLPNEQTGYRLAVTGAIRDEVIDIEAAALWLAGVLQSQYSQRLQKRYGLTDSPVDVLEEIGARRGCLRQGGKIDKHQAALILLREYRKGLLGPMTLEFPKESIGEV